VSAGHGTGRERNEFQKNVRFTAVLRRFQLASAVVMLIGVVTAAVVCAGAIESPWPVAVGGAVFGLGLLLYGLARPLARWWTHGGEDER
jgi:uncharacterized membrane protein YedE/YeeE